MGVVTRTRTSIGFARRRWQKAAHAAALEAVDRTRSFAVERRTGIPLPPRSLRARVSLVGEDAKAFLETGRRSRSDVGHALSAVGRDWQSFERILDLGCGCGRTLRWLADLAPEASLCGTDTDAEAVEWCRRHLPFARFTVNQPLPPLAFDAGYFDLVHAISVFTHIDEEFQFRWLDELRRITAPGGIVVVTLHGPQLAEKYLRADELAELESRGIYFMRDVDPGASFADWYRATFHTPEYVHARYGDYFEVLAYVSCGLNDRQDIAVLGNRGTAASAP